jgi:hypothetical protein
VLPEEKHLTEKLVLSKNIESLNQMNFRAFWKFLDQQI